MPLSGRSSRELVRAAAQHRPTIFGFVLRVLRVFRWSQICGNLRNLRTKTFTACKIKFDKHRAILIKYYAPVKKISMNRLARASYIGCKRSTHHPCPLPRRGGIVVRFCVTTSDHFGSWTPCAISDSWKFTLKQKDSSWEQQ